MSIALTNVINTMREREGLGLAKYGATVDRTDITTLGWLTHLQEELMDAVMYIEALKAKLHSGRDPKHYTIED